MCKKSLFKNDLYACIGCSIFRNSLKGVKINYDTSVPYELLYRMNMREPVLFLEDFKEEEILIITNID